MISETPEEQSRKKTGFLSKKIQKETTISISLDVPPCFVSVSAGRHSLEILPICSPCLIKVFVIMAAKLCSVRKYFLFIQVLLIQKCVLVLYQFICFSSLQSNSRELGKGLQVFPKKIAVSWYQEMRNVIRKQLVTSAIKGSDLFWSYIWLYVAIPRVSWDA